MNILLLAGGNSSERAVSLDSGAAIARALKSLGHSIEMIDPAFGLPLVESDHGLKLADSSTVALDFRAQPVAAPKLREMVFGGAGKRFDLVFLGLHGGDGENGTIQNLLELAGVPYTGSNMTASAIAMDKALTKRIMISANIATPAFHVIRTDRKPLDLESIAAIARTLGLPLIVKPNDSGSTVGLTKVDAEYQLAEAIKRSGAESPNILIERFVKGREMTVAVVDGDSLPVVEIRPKSGLYDYEAKYTKGKTEYLAPAPVSDDLSAGMQAAAVTLYELIGASGLARVDFILDGRDQFHCLELNTLPGMTELSLSPMAAKAVGISFEQLVQRIIDSALKERMRA